MQLKRRKLLLKCNIAGAPTPSRDWLEVHRILLGQAAEVVVVESLAHLDLLPDQFTFIGFPLLFKERDGSPIRAVGLSE